MPGDFNKQYKELNEDQRRAVDYIEGPLLVMAGPGTGKTQLLSLRAANILNKSDASAGNILCLTFSEAGAQEMKNRLIKVIGPDAYKITVSTYHSFGREIISRYPNYFAGSNLRDIGKLKLGSLIRELQGNLPYNSLLKETRLGGLIELISDSKQAALSPEDIEGVAKANLLFIKEMSERIKPLSESLRRVSLKSLPVFEKLRINNPSQKLGAIEPLASYWDEALEEAISETKLTNKTKSLTSFKSKFLARDGADLYVAAGELQNKKLIEFSDLYKAYSLKLKEDNLYDFDDMILLANEAISKYDELRFNLQEQYLYIMLDEYQDTNQAQAELIRLLTNNPSSSGQPNVMAVGDDDQAIYAFQGAQHSNLLDFTRQYQNVRQISLKTNYRSPQNLIDLSSGAAGQIKERLSSKDFKASKANKGVIEEINFSNEVEQYMWLARELKSVKSEVAVISPENKYLERAAAYLSASGIEMSYERRENVLDDPLIDQIATILELLENINNKNSHQCDVLLSKILAYDFIDLPTEDLWQLSWEAYEQRSSWLDLMLKRPKTRPLALMFITMAGNALIYRYDFIIDQIIGISDVVLKDNKLKSSRSTFYDYHKDEMTRIRLFQNLMVLKEEFLGFNADNQKALQITDFLSFIATLKISEEKLINDFSYGSLEAKVKLLTAHGSKGQEFDAVYLLSLVNEVWGPRRSRQAVSLPPNLEFIRRRPSDSDDERLRLLYVALSRAKDKVVSLAYELSSDGRPTIPLIYLPITSQPVALHQAMDLKPLWQKEDRRLEISEDLKEKLLKRLENYSLSPSDLRTFLDIRNAGPQTFYDKVLLKYRAPMTANMDYGVAVHDTLDWLQQSLNSSGRLPGLKAMNDQLEASLLKRRLPARDFKELKERGEAALKAYYEANKNNFKAGDFSEVNFKNDSITIGSVRLTGKVDQLISSAGSKAVTIVDYKTGRGYTSWESEPKLHLYKYQLYFYKLMVEQSRQFKGYKVLGGQLDFVEPDRTTGQLIIAPLIYSDQEMARFKSLLEAVWQHIFDLNFPSLEGYRDDVKAMKKFEDDLISGTI